jgi:hypothetical protein
MWRKIMEGCLPRKRGIYSEGFDREIEIIQLEGEDKKISKLALTSILSRDDEDSFFVDSFIFNFGNSNGISVELLKKAGFMEIGGITL